MTFRPEIPAFAGMTQELFVDAGVEPLARDMGHAPHDEVAVAAGEARRIDRIAASAA